MDRPVWLDPSWSHLVAPFELIYAADVPSEGLAAHRVYIARCRTKLSLTPAEPTACLSLNSSLPDIRTCSLWAHRLAILVPLH